MSRDPTPGGLGPGISAQAEPVSIYGVIQEELAMLFPEMRPTTAGILASRITDALVNEFVVMHRPDDIGKLTRRLLAPWRHNGWIAKKVDGWKYVQAQEPTP